MMRGLIAALLAIAAAAPATAQAPAPKPAMKLWRLDCGTIVVRNLNLFSDTMAYPGQTKTLTDSCYLIKHGDRYMLWDTGLGVELKGKQPGAGSMSMTVTRTIPEQLAEIGVKPEQISIVGISHFHGDHIGQAALFPKAKLLIGRGDLEALRATPANPQLDPQRIAPWLDPASDAEGLGGDKDVFGDGSVVILSMPGHTPGHRTLLVKLPKSGAFMLSGDQYHFTEQVANKGVPTFNWNRADTLASHDRFDRIAANLKATVIIQHEPADVAKLPAFPAAAE